MDKFTVLLLVPDYLASDYGKDTVTKLVEAEDAYAAIRNARQAAAIEYDEENAEEAADDFSVLTTLRGYHGDVTPEELR